MTKSASLSLRELRGSDHLHPYTCDPVRITPDLYGASTGRCVFPGGLNDRSGCIFVQNRDNVQFKYRLFKVFGEHGCVWTLQLFLYLTFIEVTLHKFR